MFARKVYTFEECQKFYFREATETVAQSVCIMLIALNEELGIGKERLRRVVERYGKLTAHMNDYKDDVKSGAEIRSRMKQIGLQEFADQILSMHDLGEYQQEAKVRDRVSLKEAAEAQKMLQKMKALM